MFEKSVFEISETVERYLNALDNMRVAISGIMTLISTDRGDDFVQELGVRIESMTKCKNELNAIEKD